MKCNNCGYDLPDDAALEKRKGRNRRSVGMRLSGRQPQGAAGVALPLCAGAAQGAGEKERGLGTGGADHLIEHAGGEDDDFQLG